MDNQLPDDEFSNVRFFDAVYNNNLLNIDNQLFDAVRNNDLLNVQQLVLNGSDVNSRDRHSKTPLHYAKSIEIAQVLVLNGADVNSRDGIGNTPLCYADSVEIVQFLVLNGADINLRDCIGSTLLFYAKTKEILQFLVLNGVDVNCRNSFGDTALHFAGFGDSLDASLSLIGDVDRYNNFEAIPVYRLSNCVKYAKFLLKNGADMHIKNNNGESTYDRVIQSNNNELIELFEQYNAISKGLNIKEPCSE